MSTPQPIIVCENLSAGYGRAPFLRDVNLEIQESDFFPIVGPNGAGKTTLLKIILGLIPPLSGRIKTPFAKKSPGYVPQENTIDPLYPVNVRQIVAMGLYPELGLFRKLEGLLQGRVRDVLEEFDLWEHREKTFVELSGGMKQRTLIARAMVTGPDVLVLDEPTADLDADSERQVLEMLYGLAQNGKTVVLVVHGLDLEGFQSKVVCSVDHGRVRLQRESETRT